MLDSILRASAFLFYSLGTAVIFLIVLVQRGIEATRIVQVLHLLDLPLLFLGMLLGGSSLYVSLTKGRTSPLLLIAIFLPLVLLFAFFATLNFVPPFSTL